MVVPRFLRHKPKDFGLSHERADPAQCGARIQSTQREGSGGGAQWEVHDTVAHLHLL
ncbi:hypothetical protein CC1G_13941 [Coprinopsis cinerea okayama7|uniref:Uncharacterized protein n=1 Tax=Coprinopsis cinerea (strain Okayama-7 / 130 / ATCC MYA-4618 / FGSC 9003) TaxID=240176 RepID=D6RKP9_COPC7|nr:hypothetical protein CC1G_13941 [Coprinopsis cinerea okayama7\|eukprot:XP_002911901.1 hypothetical protein CC1G_13941 [Coprinopsis cinerea okayama7\